MNYYQKYQKYKFKYYNLLNLSGSGYKVDYNSILLEYINEWYENDQIEKQKLLTFLTDDVLQIQTIISKTKPKCLNNIFKILQISNFTEDIQKRILKLEYEYRNKLLTFDNPEKIIFIINNLVDDDIKKLFDNSDLYDLYPLNMLDLETYINKF
jgi:hypothetical protein